MELAFVALLVVSAGLGLLLRTRVDPKLGQVLLAIGACALLMAFTVLGLIVFGWSPFGIWTAGLASVILLGIGAALLPIGLTWTWGHGRH